MLSIVRADVVNNSLVGPVDGCQKCRGMSTRPEKENSPCCDVIRSEYDFESNMMGSTVAVVVDPTSIVLSKEIQS